MIGAEIKKTFLGGNRGFTLVEMLVYVALVIVITVIIFNVVLYIYKTNNEILALYQVNSNANNAMDRITYEIENAEYVYLPTSNFLNYNYNSGKGGQLSLATALNPPAGENVSYLDFYLQNNTLFLKKEGSNPVALTSGSVSISSLTFSYYKNGTRESAAIDMTLNSTNNLVSNSSIHLTSVVALRSVH